MPRGRSVLYSLLYISFGILYPAYCSMIAVETKSTEDDIAWLMYWVIFGLFNIVEYFADFVLSWFPFYSLFKLGFILWSVAPVGENGAFYLYKVFVQPSFLMYRGHIDYVLTQAVEHSKEASSYLPTYSN